MDVREETCVRPGCGYSPFPMSVSFYQRARKTGETWYCPAGHGQHYIVGKTDDQKEIARLRKIIDRLHERILELVAETTVCPWPTCRSFSYSSRPSLYEHMRRVHGMPRMAEVREEAS